MPFKTTTRGNGITNSRVHNYEFTNNYDPEKLKKYLVLRRGVKISIFMFKLKPNDIVLELLWEAGS